MTPVGVVVDVGVDMMDYTRAATIFISGGVWSSVRGRSPGLCGKATTNKKEQLKI